METTNIPDHQVQAPPIQAPPTDNNPLQPPNSPRIATGKADEKEDENCCLTCCCILCCGPCLIKALTSTPSECYCVRLCTAVWVMSALTCMWCCGLDLP